MISKLTPWVCGLKASAFFSARVSRSVQYSPNGITDGRSEGDPSDEVGGQSVGLRPAPSRLPVKKR